MFAFVLGVAIGAVQGVMFPLSLWWLLLLSILALILFFYSRVAHSRESFLLAIILCGAVLGSWRGEVVRMPTPLILPFNTKVSFTAHIVAPPDERESFVYLTVLPQGERSRVRVSVPPYPLYHYGDVLTLSGVLTTPESFLTDQGTVFDYPAYLARDSIVAEMKNAEASLISPAPLSMHSLLYMSIEKLRSRIAHVIPEPAAALGSGMLLGGSNALGKELSNTFRRAGLSHVVVLSGYNVTIVSGFLLRVLTPLSRWLQLSGAGIGILLFVIATGGSASALRAGLMALTLLVARATGREYDAVRALLVATGAMILFNPLTLTADPGFQLSVMATVGLIFFSTPIEVRLVRFIRVQFIREAIATTLAAQLAVLPLIIHLSGIISLISLPLNVLILPLVPLTMALTALSAILAFVTPLLALPSAFCATLLLRFIITATRFAVIIPFSSLTIPASSIGIIICVYVLSGLGLYWRYGAWHIT